MKNFIVTIPQNSGLRRRHSAPSRNGARPRPPKPEPEIVEPAEAAPVPITGGAKGQNLQDQFLNLLRKNKTPVTMFLVKGVKLQGIVTWFDNFSILLRRDGQSQLVYKHAISTIMPGTSLDPAQFGSQSGGRKQKLLQDIFLSRVAEANVQVTMFLVNGVMLQGAVAGFDQFSLVLERGGSVCAYLAAYRSVRGKVTPLHGHFEAAAQPDTLYLHDMAVLPAHAGQGLAHALLQPLWAQARAEGLRHSALVSVQGSQAYWERQGYALHPLPDAAQQARLASYGEGAVYMARTL